MLLIVKFSFCPQVCGHTKTQRVGGGGGGFGTLRENFSRPSLRKGGNGAYLELHEFQVVFVVLENYMSFGVCVCCPSATFKRPTKA